MGESEFDNILVTRVGRSNISQAKSIFYNAYIDNELLRYLLNANRRGYQQRLRGFIREQLMTHFEGSNLSLAITQDNRLIGAAMISRADEPKTMAANWRWLLAMYSVVGIAGTRRVQKYFDQVHAALRGIDHYWISLIALHPDFQHHGYGHILMEAVHNQCEQDNLYRGITIDSCNPSFSSFFKSMKYCKFAELDVGTVPVDILFHPRTGVRCPFTCEDCEKRKAAVQELTDAI